MKKKIRLKFRKVGEMRFLSHLELNISSTAHPKGRIFPSVFPKDFTDAQDHLCHSPSGWNGEFVGDSRYRV